MMKLHALGIVAFSFAAAAQAASLVPPGWDPALAGDQVMERLAVVTAPQVKGAHDAEMVLVGDRAYVVAEVNQRRAGESAGWPEIYAALSIVNLTTLAVEKILPVARSEQVFENATLPVGSRYAPAAEKRPLLSLKRHETPSQHAVTNGRDPRTTPVQRLRTASTRKTPLRGDSPPHFQM